MNPLDLDGPVVPALYDMNIAISHAVAVPASSAGQTPPSVPPAGEERGNSLEAQGRGPERTRAPKPRRGPRVVTQGKPAQWLIENFPKRACSKRGTAAPPAEPF